MSGQLKVYKQKVEAGLPLHEKAVLRLEARIKWRQNRIKLAQDDIKDIQSVLACDAENKQR